MTAVIGIDVGTVRVGVAASDPTRTVATPVISLKVDKELMTNLRHEVESRDAKAVVVGLPKNLNGTEGDAAVKAREFAEEVKKTLGIKVELWDERLTTVQAEKSLIAGDVKRARRKEIKDSIAAAIMLQSWLDRK